MSDSTVPKRLLSPWRGGKIRPCEGEDHRVVGVHVVIRCECGAAFISTDGTVALAMARDHHPTPDGGGT